MSMNERDVMSLKPADTPDYMAPAWLGCIGFAARDAGICATFEAETGKRWTPPRNGMDAMIDAATGADWAYVKAFIEWVNVNVWGPIDGPAHGADR